MHTSSATRRAWRSDAARVRAGSALRWLARAWPSFIGALFSDYGPYNGGQGPRQECFGGFRVMYVTHGFESNGRVLQGHTGVGALALAGGAHREADEG